MKHLRAIAIFLFAILVLGSGLFTKRTSQEDRLPTAEKGKSTGGRTLEDSQIKSKQSKTTSELKVLFNDPNIYDAWALKKADAAMAWTLTKGNKNIVVAVIDTGIDETHEDLTRNLWVNKDEIPNNGIDDDHNGYIDDVHGWNFVGQNNDLSDHHGHGTHIAGIIGAEAGNGKGVVGICPEVSIMVLKYFDPTKPSDVLKNTIDAIKYAVSKKVDIINYSGGGTEFSPDEMAAIREAEKEGILFVAAAGNERSNSDYKKYYPADYGLSNII
ncbi:MAG TPA: S8 family serine peptidase, partial [Pseudobdellovibrionaceae bacterium]|nr:S8 family serine peptidase [Pseudobdellovibrionaceae bacterium]